MLQHNADFRWMRGRSDSLGTDPMTLIRQRKLGRLGKCFGANSRISWFDCLVLQQWRSAQNELTSNGCVGSNGG